MKTIKPIRTKADYKSALERIEELIASNPKEGTTIYNELDLIGGLVAEYEKVNFTI